MFASVMFGPNYEPQEPGPETIELFENVGDALTALFDRHRAHGRRPLNVDLLAGQSIALTFPAFSVGTYFQLYDIGPGNYSNDNLLEFTDEQQAAIIDQVKNREWDWHLSLNNDGYDTYVKVSMA
jgi:hypothetical protein